VVVVASRTQWRRLRLAIPPREQIEWRSRCLKGVVAPPPRVVELVVRILFALHVAAEGTSVSLGGAAAASPERGCHENIIPINIIILSG